MVWHSSTQVSSEVEVLAASDSDIIFAVCKITIFIGSILFNTKVLLHTKATWVYQCDLTAAGKGFSPDACSNAT